jgi:pimeloyl-ACP methyl ester carboxylesterase
MNVLTIGDRAIAYRVYGREVDPQRPPVLLVHGAGGSHMVWPAPLRHLAHTTVYALDLPGHGASPLPGCTGVSAYSEIVRDFVDALDLPPLLLAGHSLGAAIALDFALAYPQRLAALALIGGGARMRVSPALLEGVLHDFDATTAQIVAYSYHRAATAEQKDAYLRHLREADPHVLYGDFVACHNFDATDRLADLHTPALIICGQQDRMTPPERSRYLHDHIAGSDLLLVEDAGHNVMVEQPVVVTAALAALVERVTG